jgi:hypothetical protein
MIMMLCLLKFRTFSKDEAATIENDSNSKDYVNLLPSTAVFWFMPLVFLLIFFFYISAVSHMIATFQY